MTDAAWVFRSPALRSASLDRLGTLAAAASGSSLFDRRLETSLALDGPSIKPPCRMTERRHGDREADEERQ